MVNYTNTHTSIFTSKFNQLGICIPFGFWRNSKILLFPTPNLLHRYFFASLPRNLFSYVYLGYLHNTKQFIRHLEFRCLIVVVHNPFSNEPEVVDSLSIQTMAYLTIIFLPLLWYYNRFLSLSHNFAQIKFDKHYLSAFVCQFTYYYLYFTYV